MKTPALSIALALCACSSLDPNVGPWNGDPASDAGTADAEPDGDDPPGSVVFARDLRPIILRPKDHPTGRGCSPCHDGNAPTHVGTSLSGLDLSSLGSLRHGGGSSAARIVVPYKPDESAIVLALRGQYGFANRMPKGGPYWGDEEMRLLTTWIAEGAKGRADE